MKRNRKRCALCIVFLLFSIFAVCLASLREVRAARADISEPFSADVGGLAIEQQADYACEAGALIEITALVHIDSAEEAAENLVIRDDFPKGLTLLGQAVSGADDVTVASKGENGWKIRCPRLAFDQTLVIVSECKVETSAAGQELLNVVRARAEHTGTVRSARDLWVNTAKLGIYQSISQSSWREGETVLWQVICYNETPDTLISNLALSGLTPPEGLSVQSEEDVTLRGVKDLAKVPRSDNKTGIQTKSQRNVCNLSQAEDGWKMSLAYLAGQEPLFLQFSCLAVDEGQAETVQVEAAVEQVGSVIYHEIDWTQEPLLGMELRVVNRPMLKDARRLPREFQVGEMVEYELVIENLSDYETLRNVIVADRSLPEGLNLQQVWAGEEEVTRRITRVRKGFYYHLDELQPEAMLILRYSCSIGQAANGLELLTQASVQADNAVRLKKTAMIWVNSPQLILKQKTSRQQDLLLHEITVRQSNTGCAARNLILEDLIDDKREHILEESVRFLDENGDEISLKFWILGNCLFVHTDFLLVHDACYQVFDAAQKEMVKQAYRQPTGRREETLLTITFTSRSCLPVNSLT